MTAENVRPDSEVHRQGRITGMRYSWALLLAYYFSAEAVDLRVIYIQVALVLYRLTYAHLIVSPGHHGQLYCDQGCDCSSCAPTAPALSTAHRRCE